MIQKTPDAIGLTTTIIVGADEVSMPALTAVEAVHRGERQRTDLIGWPESWPKRYNAGNVPCDMLVGPCACGAWHKAETSILREVLQLMELALSDKDRAE